MIKHGTYSGASHYRCDCGPCRDAKRAYERDRSRKIGYGTWNPYTDAAPVRDHVERLRAAGLGWQRIAELSGVPGRTVYLLLYGNRAQGRGPSRRVRHRTAERLLAVQATLDTLSGHARVDATGTRRRLQALVAVGWPQSELARRLGASESALWQITAGSGLVRVSKHRAVGALYDELWDAAPPQGTPQQRGAVTRARRLAERRGWAPPMAWDDETIDDPDAEPVGAGYEPPKQGKLPAPSEIEHLVQGGDSLEVIADRYGVNVRSIREKLSRPQKKETTA